MHLLSWLILGCNTSTAVANAEFGNVTYLVMKSQKFRGSLAKRVVEIANII